MDVQTMHPANPMLLLLASLSYCYFLVSYIGKGMLRLLCLLPIFYFLFIIPWYFSSSSSLRGISSFFLTWITSFKLILFSFNKDPLISCENYIDFFMVAIFPLKIKKHHLQVSLIPLLRLIEVLLLILAIQSIIYKDEYPNKFLFLLQAPLVIYGLYLFLTSIPQLVQVKFCYELVQLFNKPYLATSLQDFWGKRWNRLSSDVLRQTIYIPVRSNLVNIIGIKLAKVVALLVTLAVSGVMHEIMFYHITCGMKPTWEVTWFFLLQAICMVFEAFLKILAKINGWKIVHPFVSIVITIGFVLVTFYWLLVLPVLRNGQNECDIRPSLPFR